MRRVPDPAHGPSPAGFVSLVLIALFGLLVLAPETSAKSKYCTRHSAPPGCIKIPKAAKSPKKKNQQGSKALTPRDVVNGGGLGAGPGHHRETALAWARTMLRNAHFAGYCQRFVEEAHGTRGRFKTAASAARKLNPRNGSPRSAPAGTLMFFRASDVNHGYGHVGLSLGDGRMISALKTVSVTDVAGSRYWKDAYLGWADAPAAWPGRIPPPPGPTTPDPDLSIRVTAPAFGQTVGGTVSLMAGGSAHGVAFEAYYATDPADSRTRAWHDLGRATAQGDSWALDWDTRDVPDRGNAAWGTVTVAAIALDEDGQRTGTRDYRRLAIDNTATPLPPPPTPSPAPPVPTSTPEPTPTAYPETAAGDARTWTDPSSAGGYEGQTIAMFQTVRMRCRLQGFVVQSGNPWWYRIADAPWNDLYYVSADALYNNGATSGPIQGTPWYDPAVPICP